MQDPTIAHQPSNNTPVNQPVSGYSQPQQPVPAEPKNRKRSKESWRSILSTILILITAPLVALFLTAFVFQSYQVDGPSMLPSLHNGDRLIVLKVPRSVARITGHNYIPAHGDIIVFTKHGLNDYGDPQTDKQLIKRVIGIPGDRVVINDGVVTVFNSANPNGYNPDAGTLYAAQSGATTGNTETTVNEGQVFVMGDNRGNSLDSRYFGAIDAKDIVGKLVLRVFPLDSAKSF